MGKGIRDRIRNFLRLRKQSDTVKMICLFVLTGAVFFACITYHIWMIFRYVDTPAEYILTGDGMISDKDIDELRQSKGVSKVSRQRTVSAVIQYGGAETAVDCIALSRDYIEDLYGAEISEGVSRIYMNEAAFAEFQEAISDNSGTMIYREEADIREDGTELTVRYCVGEEIAAASEEGKDDGDEPEHGMGTARKYRSAKLIICKTDREEAESFIYTAETDQLLMREAEGIRVWSEGHDLDGLYVDNLKKMGYEIENEERIKEEEHELQMKLLHIRYGLVVCGISIMGAVTVIRVHKKNTVS